MRWIFKNAVEAFPRFSRQWDYMNKACGNHPLLDSSFVGPLIANFATKDTVLAISIDSHRPGIAVLEKPRPGVWQTFQPAQNPLGLILLGAKNGEIEQAFDLLENLPGYALEFSILQQDPECTVFHDTKGLPRVEVIEYINTARLIVQGTYEEFWNSRGRDLVKNLARRHRLLVRDEVHVELAADRDPKQVDECIREYGFLEGTGWKGKKGTAVAPENFQGAFYREVLQKFCEHGEGVIYRLRFNGKTVASQLCIERNGTLIFLKMAYDESFKKFSPGFMLREEVIKHLFEKGTIRIVEFYGRVMPGWTTKWTQDFRPMFHLNFYRNRLLAASRKILHRSPASLGR